MNIGSGLNWVKNLIISASIILVVFGVIDAIRVPIYYNGRIIFFETGITIIQYLIIITAFPLVFEYPDDKNYLLVILPLAILLLLDFTMGHYYSLIASIIMWFIIVFLKKGYLRMNEFSPHLFMLLIFCVISVGFYELTRPIIPLEVSFLDKISDLVWKTYLVFSWLAIPIYTVLPYVPLANYALTFLWNRSFKKTGSDMSFKQEVFSNKVILLILVTSILLAIYLPLYNYPSKRIGADVPYYASSLKQIINSNNPIVQAFSERMSSTRPLYMLFLYSIHKLTGFSAIQVSEIAPAILLPILVLSYYILAKSFFQSKSLGALAAILTIAGVQFPIGIFASFQANLLGLVMGNLLVVSTLVVNVKKVAYPLASILSFGIMLVHSWTALCYFLAITTALAYNALKNSNKESLVRIVIIVFSALLSKPFVEFMQSPMEGSIDPIYAASVTAFRALSLDNIEKWWSNTYSLFTDYCQGFIANFFLFILSFIGIMHIRSLPEPAKCFLTAFLLTLSPLPLMDKVIALRMYFNMPLQIYSSIATYSLLHSNERRLLGILLAHLSLLYSILAVIGIAS